jgi:hypothetical protein
MENSLSAKYPELLLEWNCEKNPRLDPDKVAYNARRWANWKCERCGHEWKQRIDRRTRGSQCKKCRKWKGENAVEDVLDAHDIRYDTQKNLPGMGKMRFDFWITSLDRPVAIEFDGKQHFRPWRPNKKGQRRFTRVQRNDARKNAYCLENDIVLYRIAHSCLKRIPEIVPIFLNNLPEPNIYYSDPAMYGL